jgi:hypothetical protein
VKIAIGKRAPGELIALHELYRQEADCQLIRDSFWSRGFLDPYTIEIEDRLAGYGAIANKYDKGRLLEFYALPDCRRYALSMFRELLAVTRATHIEAQTNVPWMLMMLHECAQGIGVEKVLFTDAYTTQLACPGKGVFRAKREAGELAIFTHHVEPQGSWLIEASGEIVATGGFLSHYNPPYADLYMEVAESHRRRGFGSFLIQELKRVCYESGKRPGARCDVTNSASRGTLEKAGLLACGHLVAGAVK